MGKLHDAWECDDLADEGETCDDCHRPFEQGQHVYWEPGPYFEPRDGTTRCYECVERLERMAAEIDAEIERRFRAWTEAGSPADDPDFGVGGGLPAP